MRGNKVREKMNPLHLMSIFELAEWTAIEQNLLNLSTKGN
jgi:hypothetical protein